MYHIERYQRNPVVHFPEREWPNREIEKAPIWCSVDLRDGNQALVEPMVVEEKTEMFNLLLKLGFKEIEIGFPAASQIEFDFLRLLALRKMIPSDVHVQVLTQCREHLIRRTFEAIEGIPNPIVHIYNSTNTLQRDVVFHASREEIKQIAIDGVKTVKACMKEFGRDDIILEYSPESFMGTELDFALEVCEAVLDEWGMATPEKKVIINLPLTVEMNTPNVYADQIEWMVRHFKNRDSIVVSIHPHNDRGCGVADAEMGILAGADRVEGTLFGNGERTGNVDIITVAMNMFALGVDPKLDFSNLPHLVEVYEQVTRMQVNPRQPYSGALVFAAFSGSHQDAIAKGMHYWAEKHPEHWCLPYLYIDPKDIGRTYDGDVIRINSQSGRGGVGYIMEQQYGISMPKKMREDLSYRVKAVSDVGHRELQPDEIYKVFMDTYVNAVFPYELVDFCLNKQPDGTRRGDLHLRVDGEDRTYEAHGNGRLDAVSNAMQENLHLSYTNLTYSEHALDWGRARARFPISASPVRTERYTGERGWIRISSPRPS